jgi:hypothetical protein
MRYTTTDLVLFEPLFDLAQRESSSYFELHPKELSHPQACWVQGSLLLRDAAFDFFSGCFHAADKNFNDFGFQRFEQGHIQVLCQELSAFSQQLALNPTRDVLFSRYASMVNADIWSDISTEALAQAVLRCGEQMLDFIATNTRQSKCLWVLGM